MGATKLLCLIAGRLARKKDRSEVELDELAEYIDAFVWPSFLTYGANAMDRLRRDLVGLGSFGEKFPEPNHTKSVATVLEIDNSEGASLWKNVNEISNMIHNIMSK